MPRPHSIPGGMAEAIVVGPSLYNWSSARDNGRMSLTGFYPGKGVLVTGHTGFKGAWLCEWLVMMGARVGGFSLDIPTHPSLFEALRLQGRLRHLEGDIRSPESVASALRHFEPEIVFHLAAQSLVRKSYESPKETFDTNVGGTVNLL